VKGKNIIGHIIAEMKLLRSRKSAESGIQIRVARTEKIFTQYNI